MFLIQIYILIAKLNIFDHHRLCKYYLNMHTLKKQYY